MKKPLLPLLALGLMMACNANQPGETSAVSAEEGLDTEPSKSQKMPIARPTNIYEVNIRQYTREGTIAAFTEHLDRLQDLGVEVLWIMPVQPIGKKRRKGELGSYYSIADYTAINPEFGSLADFQSMVKKAHERGMRVILDWVANHTAWDHPWIAEHPNWYTRNEAGEIIAPVEDWSDVADLNYSAPGMPEAMRAAMRWWVEQTDIDGFRCDMAMMVPLNFWQETRAELDSIKPIFMLAEAEGPEFHQEAFDMTYGWEMHHLLNALARGEKSPEDLEGYRAKQDSLYQASDLRMFFTTNHDENSWQGTVFERMGKNHRNAFVLAATFPNGLPLIYSGQEAGLRHRLAFFAKDSISWRDSSLYPFYQQVLRLRREHPALQPADEGSTFGLLKAQSEPALYVYLRENGDEQLFVLLNFSDGDTEYNLFLPEGNWQDPVNNRSYPAGAGTIEIPAHSFLLISKLTQ